MSPATGALAWFRAWGRALRFAVLAGAAALTRSAYTPRARTVATQQIYFAAWQVLPGFLLFIALLGMVIAEITVRVAREFGLSGYALELVLRVLVLELIPLITALFVALRSGAAINTEIALMQLSGELEQMRHGGIDPLEREFVPRIAATALSVLALTVLGCVLVMVLAYIAMYGFSPWGFAEYTRIVARVFDPAALAGFAIKCLAFGAAVAVIPIAAGLDATREFPSAADAVMGGMVRLFFALGLIEILALAAEYV
jgi:phospholipid/cholesterol/gamma-HCH transport system permease protein